MGNKRNIVIAAIAVIIMFFAYSSSKNIVTSKSDGVGQGALLIADLQKNIDNVGTVIIRSKGKSFKVHKENGQWVMPNKYSYPIGVEKIRDLVQNSAKIEILEKKTTDEKNFAELGLDDPENPNSNAIRIVLLSADEKTTYADYIRGINRKGVNGAIERREIYSRLFSENQAYLVHADLNFDLSAQSLLSGETFAIKYQNLKSISFNYPKNPADNFTLSKDISGQADFAISEPHGKILKAFGKANSISSALENMSLEDIIKVEDFPVKEHEAMITYKTFEGLTLIATLFKYNDTNWLSFVASGNEKSKQSMDDAARINALAARWVYKVDFKSTGGFYYKLDDLLKD